jgi:demethylmenaquinone methyltransferase/2-methoxy-6-polyprenyl-1,4-benzoquinol methylase
MNIDRTWRARTVRRIEHILRQPGAHVLDVCCGTGDLTLAMRRAGRAQVLGSDFCHPMLIAAKRKGTGAFWFESDALSLPVAGSSFDLITAAFGFRNLTSYERGLAEFQRVLRPGGTAAILEFSQPPNRAFGAMYDFYSRNVLPRIGGFISGSRDAYTYLPESVRKFPDADGLARMMENAGFRTVTYERMTFGVVALHLAIA